MKYTLFEKRRVFHAPSKTTENKRTIVIRPAWIRVPILCYLLIPVFHTLEILRQIKSFKPDVVIGMGILNTFIAAKIARLHGVPFVYYLIDSLHTLVPEPSLRPIARLIEKWTMRVSDRILVINKTLCDYVKRMGVVDVPEVITAGVDRNRFHPKVDGQDMRKALGLKEEDMVLFFMGWLYEFSGLIEVATSIISCPERDVNLVVLGKGEIYPQLRVIADKHRDEGRIILVDWVPYDEVPRYVAAADICILPAHINDIMRNIVPIKMYEYLACGKPVVTTRLPGVLKEFGRNSGVVYASNSESVVDTARRIFWDKTEYLHHSRAAARFVQSHNWSHITDRFETVLKQMVN